MTIQTRIGMPMDEFIRLYDEAPFELIDGERNLLVPPVAEHSEIIKRLYDALMIYGREQGNIVVYSETPYILTDTPDWVKGSRVPDVMVYETSRMAAYKAQTPDWKKKPYVLVPDLCIEVISPNDIYLDVDEKVEGYLSDGVRAVWVFNPRKGHVVISLQGSNQMTRLGENDVLSNEEILPGFALTVREVFG